MKIIVALIAGVVFGLGLVVSGMSNPSKVLNFLDLFGVFDASLLFVMAGAVVTTYFGYRFAFQRGGPAYDDEFHTPRAADIDGKLVVGAVLFGIGWGLVGFCPGPALTSLSYGGVSAWLFVIAMLAGMILARLFMGIARLIRG